MVSHLHAAQNLASSSTHILRAALCLSITVLALVAVWPSTSLAAPSPTSCTIKAPLTACRIMPGNGTFQLPIPGTPAALIGVGTPDRAGKPIAISRTNLVCPSLGGIGIHIYTPASAGLLPPLHWSNGTLYYRDVKTGQCIGVASPALAAAPGVYQVVPTNGVQAMPRTGGATSSQDATNRILLLCGLLLLMVGAFLEIRRAKRSFSRG